MDFIIIVLLVFLIIMAKKSKGVSEDKLRDDCKLAYKNGYRDGRASMMGDDDE